MSVSERFDHHAKLVADMADTLGVDLLETMQRGELDAEDLRAMVHKCCGCTQPEACKGWLAQAEGEEEAPYYCRNAETFAKMQAEA